MALVVRTDEGLYGLGESGLSGREYAVAGVIEHFRQFLIGQDPLRIEHVWQQMARGAFFPASGIQSSAMSAVDVALWDIKGKALGVPVYQLLGGRTRDRVLCYCHISEGGSINGTVDLALKAKQQGWRAVRFGLPIDGLVCEPRKCVQRAYEYMRALREGLGDEIELIIDVHTRLDMPEAIRLGRLLEPLDLMFYEDPLRAENWDLYRTLRQHVHVPIAAGEQCTSKWEFRTLIENDLIDYCRLDPCLVGGITESKKIAGWCEAHHIRLAVHNPLGPISTAANVHFNLSCPNVGIMEQPKLPGHMSDVFPKQSTWSDGYMELPTAPGLGIEIDLEAAKKHPPRPWEPPQTRRGDGSVTNW